jgi:hypothetical protein
MYRRIIIIVLGLLLTLMLTTSLSAQTDMPVVQHTTAVVRTHPSQGDVREIEGGQAELFVTEEGITVNFRTAELEEGHVYSAWIVILNNPENCETSPCTATDILANTDSTNAEVTWGDGILVGTDQRMSFAGFLPAGEVPEGWYGNGITNPFAAEIHVVINDHGTLIPEMASSMLNSYRGGCTDESLPPPFPDTAKADGEPGPNTCRLVQAAIFQQPQ